ncbi:unnamed protein product [Anisakis simplex]|uniref:Trafficking protein particle complex subunit 9 (inferred by orthology to a human protein) n=1 Tax=Anisakis simplex TaxID=6269 RepID=A0A0M3K4S7_ANISI|nr:unnamed protein product [Anisakis simplex]
MDTSNAVIPSAVDHCRMLILIRQFGYRSPTTFNRILERLQRIQSLQVSDNPKRVIVANFTSSVNASLLKFGELQAHRRVIGLIGIIHCNKAPNECEQASTSALNGDVDETSSSDASTDTHATRRASSSRRQSCLSSLSLPQIKQLYDSSKEEYSSTLVDSRCITIGYANDVLSDTWSSRELLSFNSLEESDSLENGIREFMRSIFFVIESRRLDLSFEKVENPPCPALPDEQKYRMGLENKTSKQYKRKCVGRLRKQVADYTLMTGLPTLALDAYQASIDLLKQCNDLLWLAAAYEGWACSAMIIKYDLTGEVIPTSSMQRVSSMTTDQMRSLHDLSQQHSLGLRFSPGLRFIF